MQWSDLLGLLPPQVLFWGGIFLVLASVLLKKAGADSGVQILDSKGKPKAPT